MTRAPSPSLHNAPTLDEFVKAIYGANQITTTARQLLWRLPDFVPADGACCCLRLPHRQVHYWSRGP